MPWDLFSLVAQVPPRPGSRPRKRNAFIRESSSRLCEHSAREVVSSIVPNATENQQPKVEAAVPTPSTGTDGTTSTADGTGVKVVPPQRVEVSTQTDWKWVEQQRAKAKAIATKPTASSPPQPSAKESNAKEHNPNSQATRKKTKSKEQTHKPQLDGREADSGKPTNAPKPAPKPSPKPLKSILKKQVTFAPMAEYAPPPYERSPSPDSDSNSSEDSYTDPTFGTNSPSPAYTTGPSSIVSRTARTSESRKDHTTNGVFAMDEFEDEQPRGLRLAKGPRYTMNTTPPRSTSQRTIKYTSPPAQSPHVQGAYHSSPTIPYYHTLDSDLDSDTGSFIDTAPPDYIFPPSPTHTSPHKVRFAEDGRSQYNIPFESRVPSFEQGIGTRSIMRRNSNESPASFHSAVEEWNEGTAAAGAGGQYMMRGALNDGSGRQAMRYQAPTVEEEEGVDMDWR